MKYEDAKKQFDDWLKYADVGELIEFIKSDYDNQCLRWWNRDISIALSESAENE